MIRFVIALLLLSFSLQSAPPTVPVSWSLAGKWRVSDASDPSFLGWRVSNKSWRKLPVPANWYSAGLDHQGALWYRTEFSLPTLDTDQMATVEFDGVDYFADVWLNHQHLTRHEGYFQRFAVDVTSQLGRYNQLAVRVDSPFEDPDVTWPLHKNLIKGILNQHDSRPGGAWSAQGQDANSGGIWAPVRLRISRGAAIDHLILRPVWPGGLSRPELHAEIVYRAARTQQVTLTLNARSANFSGKSFQQQQPITLQATGKAPGRLSVILPMPDAKLWWPIGYGHPHLYEVTATLHDDRGILDRRSSKTGLRQVVEQPGNRGWLINGQRVFVRGTNYIGSPWLSTMNRQRYLRDFSLVEKMNANAIRVHGHVANRSLYQAADETGLLIWQDVPLQWGYNDSNAFADNAVRQTQEMVEQFGNSPSIVVWGGQNEPPFNSPWMKKRFPDWHPDLNRHLTQRVADTLAKDQSRIVHPFSAVEEHYWAGWYFGSLKNLLEPAKTATITEFGAQALPRLSTLKTIIPARDLWPATTKPGDPKWVSWKYHNFQPIQTFQNVNIARGENMQTFIRNTQNYQAQLVAMAAESYRRQKYQPVTALFQFMFVETWPSINWGVVDYLRQPKRGYYALRRAYQPVLASIAPASLDWYPGQPGKVSLWAINDLPEQKADSVLVWKITQGQRVLNQGKQNLTIMADSAEKITELEIKPVNVMPLRVEAYFVDTQGKKIGENQLEMTVSAPKASK